MRFMLAIGVGLAIAMAAFGADENLIANAGFEEGPTEQGAPIGWKLREEEGVKLRTDGAHSGDHYVRLIDESDQEGLFLESHRIAARPNGTYTASAWFRTEDNCSPGIYVNFYDDLGTRIHHKFNRVEGPTDGWVQGQVSAVAPQDTWRVSATIYAYIGDIGQFDADDANLTVEGGSEPLQESLSAKPGDKSAVDIGSRLELFVDDYVIDGIAGAAERRLHHPTPREVALELDKPWEGDTSAYFAVVKDDDRILLYYRGSTSAGDQPQVTCVAESTDGVNFARPNLGLFEFDGAKDNNIIWKGRGAHNFTPFKDPNPAAAEERKFKALGHHPSEKGLAAYVSADGIHWRQLVDEPVITKGAFDSQNLAFWDPIREIYVDYHRDFRGVRDIMTSTSEDFVNWTEPQFIEYADSRKEHMYTNGIRPYLRAPHIYIGLPARFVPNRKKVPEHPVSGVSDAVLMSSRDGTHFQRWEEAFIRPGPEPQVWTDRNNYPAWGMLQSSPEEITLYWTEHYRHPTMRFRRGTIRTDGFVSVHAGGDSGEIITRPLVFSGDKLVVNYATSAIGSLRFALCDESGEAIEGYSLGDSEVLFGNEIEHTVTWEGGGDLADLAGTPVRLRVRLHAADLYSFRFAQGQPEE